MAFRQYLLTAPFDFDPSLAPLCDLGAAPTAVLTLNAALSPLYLSLNSLLFHLLGGVGGGGTFPD